MEKMKEVLFEQYCEHCVNKLLPEDENPCNACLQVPARPDSHKPLYFKED